MSSLTYPAIAPDYMRELTLSDFGVKVDNIFGYDKRTPGSTTGLGTLMKFEYKDRTATELNTLISFYKSTRGQWASFNIPLSLWRQPAAYTDAASSLLEFNVWRFNNQISIETTKRDVYTFNVEFRSVAVVIAPEPDSFPCNLV